ncbi:MAG: SDR family oxidoreductase [Rhodospirillales bacterium]|nr:SDR family oxidoreductase [Rhodospirillales bacterium]MDE2197491.1 SDR family oxidoreductase [Rhodospirillales bacterium]MDE2574105.1 SDR family oxidoreductase [Rhodospirillales bacterium]
MPTALVTGGSSGIGAEICRVLLADGYDVVSLALEDPDWSHPRLHTATADLMDVAATRAVAADLAQRFAFSHVIHNAGVIRPALLADARAEDVEALARLHLVAPMVLVQAALPAMRAAGFGRIILLSSRAALGAETRTAYSATKAGIAGLVRTWALELAADGITVNAVAPGPVGGTAMFDAVIPPGSERAARLAASIPVRRLGRPADVAHAVGFFASPHSGFITGQTLFVCGGASVGALSI